MKIIRSVQRAVRRRSASPFPASTTSPPLIVHCCHHKIGTVWFINVLSAVAERYGWRLHIGPQSTLGSREVFIDDHSRLDPQGLRDFRGSHMIRDPRDLIVSGYFYHLRTTEPWALIPQEAYGGLSYQEHLKTLDQREGLLAEIRRASSTVVAAMMRWNFGDRRFLELRYEDLIEDEEGGFRKLFEFYGFNPDAVDACTEIAAGFSLKRVKDKSSHIRSGVPNEWSEYFDAGHREVFKSLTNDAAFALGYETDPDW